MSTSPLGFPPRTFGLELSSFGVLKPKDPISVVHTLSNTLFVTSTQSGIPFAPATTQSGTTTATVQSSVRLGASVVETTQWKQNCESYEPKERSHESR